MKNLSKRNNIIIAVVSFILVISLGIGAYFVIDNNKTIEAKHNDIYTIEYGTDFDLEQVKYYYSDYDNNINELEIDTFKIGGYGYPFRVKNTDMTLNVIVEDTQMPEITGIEDTYTITQGDELTIDAKGNDKVDGELEVKFDKDINVNEVGEQTIKATVEDKNGNITEKEFKVVVEEKVEELIETPPTTNPGNTINNNTNTNSNNTANKPSTGNTGGSTQKPTETPKPVEPETSQRPGPSAEGGWVYYKDYGKHNACRADVTNELMKHDDWRSNFCDDWGYMYYKPDY